MDQVMTALRKANYEQYVRRLPSEYEQGQEMLQVKLQEGVLLHLTTINTAWMFVLAAREDDGSWAMPSARRPYSAGLPLGSAAQQVAQRLIEHVPDVQRQVQEALAQFNSEPPARSRSAPTTSADVAADRTVISETQVAGIGSIVEQQLSAVGLNIDVRYMATSEPQFMVTVAGFPRFIMRPVDGTWWFFFANNRDDIVGNDHYNTIDTNFPIEAPAALVAITLCYFLLKQMAYGNTEAGLYPDGLSPEAQASILAAASVLAGEVDEDGPLQPIAASMLEDLQALH